MKLAKNGTLTGVLFVLAGAFCWGTLPIFSKFVYLYGSDPLTAAAWRSYLAAATFIIWFSLDGTMKKLRPRDIPFYIVLGVVAAGGTFIFYMTAVDMLSTSMAAILLYTGPSFVVILSRIFCKTPITRVKFAALLCSFIGCMLTVKAYDFGNFISNWKGILIGLLSGFCYSLTTVLGARRSNVYSGRENAGFMIMFSPLAFLAVKPVWNLAQPNPQQLAGYAGLAIVGSVLAYIFYMRGLETGLDGGTASITATVEPVVATCLGVAIFRDPIEWVQVLGIAIVLLGVCLPSLKAARR